MPTPLDAQNTTLTITFDDDGYNPQVGDVIGRIKAHGSYLSDNWYNLTLQSFGSSGDTIAVQASLNGFIQVVGKHNGTFVVTYATDRYNVEIEAIDIY